jgi:hypothetical protein
MAPNNTGLCCEPGCSGNEVGSTANGPGRFSHSGAYSNEALGKATNVLFLARLPTHPRFIKPWQNQPIRFGRTVNRLGAAAQEQILVAPSSNESQIEVQLGAAGPSKRGCR